MVNHQSGPDCCRLRGRRGRQTRSRRWLMLPSFPRKPPPPFSSHICGPANPTLTRLQGQDTWELSKAINRKLPSYASNSIQSPGVPIGFVFFSNSFLSSSVSSCQSPIVQFINFVPSSNSSFAVVYLLALRLQNTQTRPTRQTTQYQPKQPLLRSLQDHREQDQHQNATAQHADHNFPHHRRDLCRLGCRSVGGHAHNYHRPDLDRQQRRRSQQPRQPAAPVRHHLPQLLGVYYRLQRLRPDLPVLQVRPACHVHWHLHPVQQRLLITGAES